MSAVFDIAAPRVSLDESLRRLKTLVSPLTGVIKSYWEWIGRSGEGCGHRVGTR
jgi:hypothetical protein